jgi:hypothetical protein
MPQLILVGESNPLGGDPYFALYDEPERHAGHRLRRLVLGLHQRTYRGPDILRVNLCDGPWSAPAARKRAIELDVAHQPPAVIVLLGRQVASAFGLEHCPAFTRSGRIILLPHPSGRNCALWTRENIQRARAMLSEVLPGMPFGEADEVRP